MVTKTELHCALSVHDKMTDTYAIIFIKNKSLNGDMLLQYLFNFLIVLIIRLITFSV